MRYHDGGARLHRLAECVSDLMFFGRVNRRGGVIENQHSGIGQDRSSNCQPLALPARQRQAPFANFGAVPVWQLIDELFGARQPSCPANLLLGRSRINKGDVLKDRRLEKKRVLEHDAHGSAKGLWVEGTNIDAVKANSPGVDVVETGQQASQGRFARPGSANKGNGLPRLDRKGQILENRFTFVTGVRKVDVLKLDTAQRCRGRQRCRRLWGNDAWFHREQLADTHAGCGGPLSIRDRHTHAAQRLDQQHDIDVEADQRANREITFDDQMSAVRQHRDQANIRGDLHRRQITRSHQRCRE